MQSMPAVQVNGVWLHCDEYGSGPAMLGIHGSPSAAVVWSEPAEKLSRLGRCIVYDRRGFGRDSANAPTMLDLDDHVADAAGLLVSLDAAPAVVIGRSTGGLIAVALALQHQALVRALVLLEPAVFGIDEQATAWARSVREAVLARAADRPAGAAEIIFENVLGPGSWPALSPDAQALFSAGGPAALAEIRGRGLDLSAQPYRPTDEVLRRLTAPTLIVTGRDSYAAAAAVDEHLAAVLPSAQHAYVAGGHVIDPASPIVLDFVAEVLAGPLT
jgi:pimeloyl-ACP methyl ester carboxylesterase